MTAEDRNKLTTLSLRYVYRHRLSVDAMRVYLESSGSANALFCIWLELSEETRGIISRLYVMNLLLTKEGAERFAADSNLTVAEACMLAFN